MEYEELCLFIHRDFREVIVHTDGHIPPKFKKTQTQHHRIVRFLEAMRTGAPFTPSDHEDNNNRANLWLPLLRMPAPARPEGATLRLVVVSDPMGAEPGLSQVLESLKEMKAKGELLEVKGEPFKMGGAPPKPIERLQLHMDVCNTTHEVFAKEAGDRMRVDSVKYTDEQKQFNWHCKPEDVPSRQLMPKDIIDSDTHDAEVRSWAKGIIADIAKADGEEIALVGLGTGAFIALGIARQFVVEHRYVPAGLFIVNPPLRLPWATVATPAVLEDCPMHTLVDENASSGPAWRYEICTRGPYKTSIYDDIDEMVQYVVNAARRR